MACHWALSGCRGPQKVSLPARWRSPSWRLRLPASHRPTHWLCWWSYGSFEKHDRPAILIPNMSPAAYRLNLGKPPNVTRFWPLRLLREPLPSTPTAANRSHWTGPQSANYLATEPIQQYTNVHLRKLKNLIGGGEGTKWTSSIIKYYSSKQEKIKSLYMS